MKPWDRLFNASALVAILVLVVTVAAVAQHGTSIVTRIKFARGRTTAVEKGAVHRGMSHDYLLKAGAGQNMTVHLAATEGVCFDLFSPAMQNQLVSCSKDWEGALPATGDYRINVLPDTTTERNIGYTLEVTVR